MTTTDIPIRFDTLPTANGQHLGIATLWSEKSLNALSLEMIRPLAAQLQQWHDDNNITAVLLRGAGDKAFCAGGNIRQLYNSMLAHPTLPNPAAVDFFGHEYALYRQMHMYAKPIVLWASGIVMGGGLGLTAAASHRIVTDTTRMAMPEITIGLYPDAGGSWFLQRMPAKSGLFLGLTGIPFNGRDAIITNLGDYAMSADAWPQLLAALQQADWQTDARHNHAIASHTLNTLHQPHRLPESQLLPHLETVHDILNAGDIHAVDERLRAGFSDPWLQRAADTYSQGCPATAALTWRLFERARHLSLAQILHMELIVSLHCCHNGDFQEGVRALLVDKDKQPRWIRSLAECSPAYIDSHFVSPFAAGEHPFDAWLRH